MTQIANAPHCKAKESKTKPVAKRKHEVQTKQRVLQSTAIKKCYEVAQQI